MSKILFDKNGDLYRATSYEKVTEDELKQEITEAKERAEEVEAAVNFSNDLQHATAPSKTPQAETPAAPVAETPAPTPAPEVPTAEVATQPEPTTPPAEPQAETPTPVDPATAPAPAPIVLN